MSFAEDIMLMCSISWHISYCEDAVALVLTLGKPKKGETATLLGRCGVWLCV